MPILYLMSYFDSFLPLLCLGLRKIKSLCSKILKADTVKTPIEKLMLYTKLNIYSEILTQFYYRPSFSRLPSEIIALLFKMK